MQSNGQSTALSAVNGIVDQIFGAMDKTDAKAAAKRVVDLRQRYPDESADQLAERVIRQRSLQAATIGAATSGAAIIPGLGTIATLIFGVAADLQMTYKIQSEMVLELAALYGRPIDIEDKRYVVALVTGMSAGANQLVRKAGTELAEQATERLAGKLIAKSLPVIGIAASAGINLVATYLIARRAQAYFRQDGALVDWEDQVRALTGVDERKLISWLVEGAERSWQVMSSQTQSAARVVASAGRSAGRAAATAAGKSWRLAKAGAGSAAEKVGRWRQQRRRRQNESPAGPEGNSPIEPM
jgi:uncharacterized protein (DUF697 family)